MTSEHEHGPAASGVVRHLVHCRPCRESLATMGDEDAAVAFLEAQRDEPGAVTTVDRVLASTATAGKQLVADLIYELAKGCLLSDEEFARLVKPFQTPRDVDTVCQDLGATAPLLGNAHITEACASVPASVARHDDMFELAGQLLRVLEKVEGRSPRGDCLEAHSCIQRGHVTEAMKLVRPLTTREDVSDHWRRIAAATFVRAAIIDDRYTDAENVLDEANSHGFAGALLDLFSVANATLQGRRDDALARLQMIVRRPIVLADAERASAVEILDFIGSRLDVDTDAVRAKAGVLS